MNKKTLLTGFLIAALCLALASSIQADETESESSTDLPLEKPRTTTTYTPTTKTVCDQNGTCTLTLYSGIMQVYEDEQWKPISEARSLLGYYDIVYLEKEYAFNIEVIDFNLYEIELETTFLGHPLDYPEFCTYKSEQEFKCQFKNNVKWDECTEPEDKEPICTEQTIKFDMKYEMKDGIIVANDTKFQYKGNTLDKKYSFGGNSTTIVLQDADTENLEDEECRITDRCYGAGTQLLVGKGTTALTQQGFIKFNTSSIPESQTIDNAALAFYITFNGYDAGEDPTTWVHEVDNLTWIETEQTIPTGVGDLLDTNESIEPGQANFWLFFNVTSWVEEKYTDENVSFRWTASDDYGNADMYVGSSKEHSTAAQRPILTITYSEALPEDSCSCPASGHWQITNSDNCTLADTCSLVGGDLHLVHGALTITSTGTLSIPAGNKIIIEDEVDVNFTIQDGGTLAIHK